MVNRPRSGRAGCAAFACLLTRWWPTAAALASTCAGTAATRGDAPGAGPRTRRGWPLSDQAAPAKRKNRSNLVSRRRALPPPGEWRCRTRQRQGAVRGGTSVVAGRAVDDGTDTGAHDSGIAPGQAGYLLAICDRLYGRGVAFCRSYISLPPSERTALLLCLRMGQQGFCRIAFRYHAAIWKHVCAVHPRASRATAGTFDLPGLA